MHRIFARHLRFTLTFFLAFCSVRALCQAMPWDYVPNQPYTAEFNQTTAYTLAHGIQVQRETRLIQARDSQGRTRIETFAPNDSWPGHDPASPLMVNLYVPVRRQFIQLFPGKKTARVMTFPGAGPIPTHGPNLKAIQRTNEALPGQTIQGIYAVGTRTTEVIPSDGPGPNIVSVTETWVSPELNIALVRSYKTTNTHGDQTTTEIRRLDRIEPNAALFEIPPDYEIVNVTAGPRQ